MKLDIDQTEAQVNGRGRNISMNRIRRPSIERRHSEKLDEDGVSELLREKCYRKEELFRKISIKAKERIYKLLGPKNDNFKAI